MDRVTEIAFFYVNPGDEDAFSAAALEASANITVSAGCRSLELRQGVETPTTFVLTVEWESLAHHQAFRDTERLAQWRAPIAPFFARAPSVEHYVRRG